MSANLYSSMSMFSYHLAATSFQPLKKKTGMERWRSSQCEGGGGEDQMAGRL